MRAEEERDRARHTFWGGGGEQGGEDGHRETRRRHVGLDRIHPPTQAEAILDLGQASASLPVFFHKRSLLYDPVFALFGFCVRKCLLV